MRTPTPHRSRTSWPPLASSWQLAVAAAAGYAAGLLPSAALAARMASGGRVDLRTAGTGNPGGANAAAVLGRRWGYTVMAADIAKGAVACRIGRGVAGDAGQHVAGVATSVGQCLATCRRTCPST